METLGHRSALAIENALLFAGLERSYLETVESLVKAVEAKDRYTSGHSEHVAALAKDIAAAAGLDKERTERVYMAGLLHDVGKIGISSKILNSPARLTATEYDEIKLHPIKGYEILKPISGLEDLAEIILQHHERFDGAGYPNGIKGQDILLEARILAVADAFQAMISNRPYREKMPAHEALREISKGKGSQFDPQIVDTFLAMIKGLSDLSEYEDDLNENPEQALAG